MEETFTIQLAPRYVKLQIQKLLNNGEITIEEAKVELSDLLKTDEISQETYDECLQWLNEK